MVTVCRIPRYVLGLGSIVLSACGGPELRGVVQSMPSAAADGHVLQARPLAGARVDLVCGPRKRVLRSFRTDASGKLWAPFEQQTPNGCWFVVSSTGYVTRTIRVLDACAVGRASRCDAMSLRARLVPGRAP